MSSIAHLPLEWRPDRPLVFTHVPKCAGTTFNTALAFIAGQLGQRNVIVSGATSWLAEPHAPASALAHHNLTLDQFHLVSGHLPFAHFREKAASLNLLVSLRDPVARALSDIFSQPAFGEDPERAYAEVLASAGAPASRVEFLIDNMHVRMLANDPRFGKPCTTEMLDEAAENIEGSYALVFSLATMTDALDEVCRQLDMGPIAVVPQNVTDYTPDEIPAAVVEAVKNANRFDMELVERFSKRTSDSTAPAQPSGLFSGAPPRTAVNVDSLVPVSDPRVPSDWQTSAPALVLGVDGSASVRESWLMSRAQHEGS